MRWRLLALGLAGCSTFGATSSMTDGGTSPPAADSGTRPADGSASEPDAGSTAPLDLDAAPPPGSFCPNDGAGYFICHDFEFESAPEQGWNLVRGGIDPDPGIVTPVTAYAGKALKFELSPGDAGAHTYLHSADDLLGTNRTLVVEAAFLTFTPAKHVDLFTIILESGTGAQNVPLLFKENGSLGTGAQVQGKSFKGGGATEPLPAQIWVRTALRVTLPTVPGARSHVSATIDGTSFSETDIDLIDMSSVVTGFSLSLGPDYGVIDSVTDIYLDNVRAAVLP